MESAVLTPVGIIGLLGKSEGPGWCREQLASLGCQRYLCSGRMVVCSVPTDVLAGQAGACGGSLAASVSACAEAAGLVPAVACCATSLASRA